MKKYENNEIEKMLHDLVEDGASKKNRIYQEVQSMKDTNKKRKKHWKPVVAACALVFTFTITGVAQEFYGIIKEAVLPSGSGLVQMKVDPNAEVEPWKIPDELAVYDENGKRVYEISYEEFETKKFFTEDGVEILVMDEDKFEESDDTVITTLEEVSPKLTFKPFVLNDKYTLEKVVHFDTENGNHATKVQAIGMDYKGPKGDIYISETENTPDWQSTGGGEEEVIEKTIDGTTLIMQGHTFMFEKDNTLFSISYHGANTEDLIQLYKDLIPYQQ